MPAQRLGGAHGRKADNPISSRGRSWKAQTIDQASPRFQDLENHLRDDQGFEFMHAPRKGQAAIFNLNGHIRGTCFRY